MTGINKYINDAFKFLTSTLKDKGTETVKLTIEDENYIRISFLLENGRCAWLGYISGIISHGIRIK
jgi:hypothetical protein